MGDSAGGGLVLALINALPTAEQPDMAVVYSPWTDLALTGQSLKTNADIDPMINPDMLPHVRSLYLQKNSPLDPRASPLYGTFTDAPPVVMVVGGREVLYDDTKRLAQHLQQQGVFVTLFEEPLLFHAFPVFVPQLPESQQLLSSIKTLILHKK